METEIARTSRAHPTLGCRKVAAKLRSAGFVANKKAVRGARGEKKGRRRLQGPHDNADAVSTRDCHRLRSIAITFGPGTSSATGLNAEGVCEPSTSSMNTHVNATAFTPTEPLRQPTF